MRLKSYVRNCPRVSVILIGSRRVRGVTTCTVSWNCPRYSSVRRLDAVTRECCSDGVKSLAKCRIEAVWSQIASDSISTVFLPSYCALRPKTPPELLRASPRLVRLLQKKVRRTEVSAWFNRQLWCHRRHDLARKRMLRQVLQSAMPQKLLPNRLNLRCGFGQMKHGS